MCSPENRFGRDREVMTPPLESCVLRPRGTDTWPLRRSVLSGPRLQRGNDALALTQQVDSGKAVRLLGWQPRHGGFLDEVEVFYRAWKARQGVAPPAQ